MFTLIISFPRRLSGSKHYFIPLADGLQSCLVPYFVQMRILRICKHGYKYSIIVLITFFLTGGASKMIKCYH